MSHEGSGRREDAAAQTHRQAFRLLSSSSSSTWDSHQALRSMAALLLDDRWMEAAHCATALAGGRYNGQVEVAVGRLDPDLADGKGKQALVERKVAAVTGCARRAEKRAAGNRAIKHS